MLRALSGGKWLFDLAMAGRTRGDMVTGISFPAGRTNGGA